MPGIPRRSVKRLSDAEKARKECSAKMPRPAIVPAISRSCVEAPQRLRPRGFVRTRHGSLFLRDRPQKRMNRALHDAARASCASREAEGRRGREGRENPAQKKNAAEWWVHIFVTSEKNGAAFFVFRGPVRSARSCRGFQNCAAVEGRRERNREEPLQ